MKMLKFNRWWWEFLYVCLSTLFIFLSKNTKLFYRKKKSVCYSSSLTQLSGCYHHALQGSCDIRVTDMDGMVWTCQDTSLKHTRYRLMDRDHVLWTHLGTWGGTVGHHTWLLSAPVNYSCYPTRWDGASQGPDTAHQETLSRDFDTGGQLPWAQFPWLCIGHNLSTGLSFQLREATRGAHWTMLGFCTLKFVGLMWATFFRALGLGSCV